jgi:hypothetical protein
MWSSANGPSVSDRERIRNSHNASCGKVNLTLMCMPLMHAKHVANNEPDIDYWK